MSNQKDIAALAKVSQMTVSLALRDSPVIPEITKQRIRALARELDYRPDPLVSALMRQRRRKDPQKARAKIAFLHDNPKDPTRWVSANYTTGCFTGAQAFAAHRGYLFEAVNIHQAQLSGRRLSQILWTQNVQGILIAPMPLSATLDLDWQKFAAVSLDYSHAALNVHRVIDDHTTGMTELIAQLVSLGYQRPALVMRESVDDRTNHQRLGAFLAQRTRKSGFAEIPPLFFDDLSWDAQKFLRWIRRFKPDVLIAGDYQVVAALEECGLAGPDKIGVVLYCKETRTRNYSGLSIDAITVGEVAARQLISMVENNERGLPAKPTTTYVDATCWSAGNSLRDLSAASATRWSKGRRSAS
ncbi:MAG: LacI family DNA-binding transcriptional regulator [Lacunisphaera sp.]|nr:LacI family DNA-binding transcriptional regulator [Lacunisphaera sp.]